MSAAQVLATLLMAVLALGFWMWMFSDMTHNPELPDEARPYWFLAFIFTNFFAAAYYYITVYRERR